MIECYTFVRYNKPVLTLTPFLREGHDLLGEQVVMYAGGMRTPSKRSGTSPSSARSTFATGDSDNGAFPSLFSALAHGELSFFAAVRSALMIDELLISVV